jgi:hypothetical protein
LLHINRMFAAGFEEKAVVGVYFRVKGFHCLFELNVLIKHPLHYDGNL